MKATTSCLLELLSRPALSVRGDQLVVVVGADLVGLVISSSLESESSLLEPQAARPSESVTARVITPRGEGLSCFLSGGDGNAESYWLRRAGYGRGMENLPLAVTGYQLSVWIHVTAVVVGLGMTFAEAVFSRSR